MKQSIQKTYGCLHRTVVDALRKSPVPSRFFGPPKGTIPNIREWIIDSQRKSNGDQDSSGYSYQKVRDARRLARKGALIVGPDVTPYIRDHELQEIESFVACIPHARVLMRTGVVVTEDDLILEESCCWGREWIQSDIEFNSLKPLLKGRRLPGSYTTIISRSWTNYCHWFTECLTRLCVAESIPDVPILLPETLTDWHKESLLLMGVDERRWVLLDKGCYEVDNLYFPSFPGLVGRIADWAHQRLRQRMTQGLRTRGGQRVYISREGTNHRRVTNESEFTDVLRKAGFTCVAGHTMTVREQAELFANADIIVGVHGAGMTNIIFAPPGTHVVEILDPAHANCHYYNIAYSQELIYRCLFAANESVTRGQPVRKGYDDIAIPIDIAMKAIREALSA